MAQVKGGLIVKWGQLAGSDGLCFIRKFGWFDFQVGKNPIEFTFTIESASFAVIAVIAFFQLTATQELIRLYFLV